METKIKEYKLVPTFGDSFGTGWNVMVDNFLRLFLVAIIMGMIMGPTQLFQFNLDKGNFHNLPWNWYDNWEHFFSLASLGMLAAFLGLVALLYTLLVVPVFKYGSKMIFVQATRRIKPDFELLVKGFMENYLSIILANLLVAALVIIGLFALIVPGIIIGCRLAFVAYIVMDKKVDPIEAVEMSWRLTRGHGWTIFLMGFVSFFIFILGFCMCFVGVIPASMWVSSSFATLYQSVLQEKEKPVIEAAA
jgi:hypothetical protein